jgi:molybdopterin-dependent oxidoreductase alpha subunit
MTAGRPDPPIVAGAAARALERIGLHPGLWAGWSPNGRSDQKPRHYRDMLRVAREQLPAGRYAWQVLTKGVCDGCALGVAGLHDWTLEGVHLCTTRLELLEFNTMGPLDERLLTDVGPLRRYSSTQLRKLGRLAHPMRRRAGEAGFTRISWSEALEAVTAALSQAPAERIALYLTSKGLTNETYYVAGKAARAIGTANIDSAARVCHAPSTVGMKQSIGVAAATCSLRDVIESDLIVLWGTNPANNQPVFTKYLHRAKERGARVIVVNPYLEPGLDRYWVPSIPESALFGTRICDLHVPVRVGGDIAFATAALKLLDDHGGFDEAFVEAHTEGVDELRAALALLDLDDLLVAAGVGRGVLEAFVDAYDEAAASVLIWSMGITQHTFGVDGVRSIVNLALAKGNVGRNGAGLMPIRGHSGVQGGAEMGAYATALPGGVGLGEESAAALSHRWGFEVPAGPGLVAPEMVEAAGRCELDVLWCSGGNFLDVMPDPPAVRAALERTPLRIHQDVVLTSQMLVDGDDVLLLPVTTRYEQEGGGTSTTTERRVAFSPEVPRQLGEARSEWRLFAEVASRVRPEVADRFGWEDNRALRAEIAEVVPSYDGIQHLERTGDAIQWGGRHLCPDGRFPTCGGRGAFTVVEVPDTGVPEDMLRVTTRRGKQFNSILWAKVDPLTGAGRDAVYMDPADASYHGLREGDKVLLRSAGAGGGGGGEGEMVGTVRLADLPRRNAQVHWPEGNALLAGGGEHRDSAAGIPEFQTLVTIEAL